MAHLNLYIYIYIYIYMYIYIYIYMYLFDNKWHAFPNSYKEEGRGRR